MAAMPTNTLILKYRAVRGVGTFTQTSRTGRFVWILGFLHLTERFVSFPDRTLSEHHAWTFQRWLMKSGLALRSFMKRCISLWDLASVNRCLKGHMRTGRKRLKG